MAVVAVDQITKLLVAGNLAVGESIVLIPKVLRFTYVQNEGAAFGMLADKRWVFMVISTAAIIGIFVYLWKFRPKSKLACTALALIVGGGIGNMIDRCYLTYVIDFIDFYAFPKIWMWVFNVADSCVCVGGGLLALWCIVEIVRELQGGKKPAEKTEEAAVEDPKPEEAAVEEPKTEETTDPREEQKEE